MQEVSASDRSSYHFMEGTTTLLETLWHKLLTRIKTAFVCNLCTIPGIEKVRQRINNWNTVIWYLEETLSPQSYLKDVGAVFKFNQRGWLSVFYTKRLLSSLCDPTIDDVDILRSDQLSELWSLLVTTVRDIGMR